MTKGKESLLPLATGPNMTKGKESKESLLPLATGPNMTKGKESLLPLATGPNMTKGKACCLWCIANFAAHGNLSPVKRICVFEHSVMTNFNCACPVIQRSQGSGFLSEGSSSLTACMSEQ